MSLTLALRVCLISSESAEYASMEFARAGSFHPYEVELLETENEQSEANEGDDSWFAM